MSRLTLEQFKTDNKNANESRLSLDQFKSQNSDIDNQELEKLTGGVLGACHSTSWWDDVKQTIKDAIRDWDNGTNQFPTYGGGR